MTEEEPRKLRFPFFKEGMNPKMLHQEYRVKLLDMMLSDKQTVWTMTSVSEKLGCCEYTASKLLTELAMEGKLIFQQVGSSRVFQINEKRLAEMLNNIEARKYAPCNQ